MWCFVVVVFILVGWSFLLLIDRSIDPLGGWERLGICVGMQKVCPRREGKRREEGGEEQSEVFLSKQKEKDACSETGLQSQSANRMDGWMVREIQKRRGRD